ncbi:MAG: NAD-dependent epimerase/dehydratase family protein, partial [Chitinophagaceae bacterium]
MKVFITGATGFIGDRLAKKLAETGHDVHALVRTDLPQGLQHKGIRYFAGDITQPSTINKAIAGCEQVY